MPERCPAVLALVPDASASSLWRVQWPFGALAQQGARVAWAAHTARDLDALMLHRDAVLLSRQAWQPAARPQAVAWRDRVHRLGAALWLDLDDDYLSPASQAHLRLAPGQQLAGRVSADVQFALSLVDGVTVSTAPLATLVQPYTAAPVVVVPNALDWAWWQQVVPPSPPRRAAAVTLGWAGAPRLEADFGPLLAVWARLAARYPAVQFVFAGACPPAALAVLPADRVTVRPMRPLAEYPHNYAGIDVFCCPLAAEAFNACKSPIKAFEAGYGGAAVVASPTVYGAVLQHERTGLLATTAAEWEAALSAVIEDAALRCRLAQRWQKQVRARYSLAANLYRWPAAWQALLTARPRVSVA